MSATFKQQEINIRERLNELENHSHIATEIDHNTISDFYMGTFFTSNTDTDVKIGVSSDGKSFNVTKNLGLSGRDPSIIYRNGAFYIAVTEHVNDSYDAVVYASSDLTNWTKNTITFGTGVVSASTFAPDGGTVACDLCWAPQWHIENDDVYLIYSLHYAADTVDTDGTSITNMRCYYSKGTLGNLTFDSPTKMDLPDEPTIDASLIEHNGTMYCLTSDEFTRDIDVYTGTSITSTFSSLATLPMGYVEGPITVKLADGTFNIYFDRSNYEDGAIYYVNTSNFTTFGLVQKLNANETLRHGDMVLVTGEDKPAIESMFSKTNYASTNNISINSSYFELNGTVSIEPLQDAIYSITGANQANVTILESSATRFYINVRTATPSAYCKVLSGTYYEPSQGTSDWFGLLADNNQLIEVVMDDDGKFRATKVTYPNKSNLDLRGEGGTGADINNGSVTWIPALGATYSTTSGDTGATTIHLMEESLPKGWYFDLLVYSAVTDGRIILKNAWLTNVGGDITIDGSAGYDGKMVRIVKIDATKWSVLNAG